MIKFLASAMAVMAILVITGCTPQQPTDQGGPDALALAIHGLGPDVDPEEADRAARIAYSYSLQLAQEYNVTDPAIVHNAKIYQGYRTRGLCNHWTEDLSRRLKQEGFRTLTVHWATSPPTEFRIIHHSVIISARGDTINEGLLLDPWRFGGALFWARPQDDKRYDWRPRMEVREELLQSGKLPSVD